MDTYLLDTNLVSVLYDARRPNHQAVRNAIAALDPASPQLVSAITVGELRFGLALSRAAGQPLAYIEACIELTEEHPLAEVGRYTAEAFGYVKSSVALQRVDVQRRIPGGSRRGPIGSPVSFFRSTRTICGLLLRLWNGTSSWLRPIPISRA